MQDSFKDGHLGHYYGRYFRFGVREHGMLVFSVFRLPSVCGLSEYRISCRTQLSICFFFINFFLII
jgi:hypothetical protein